MTGQPEDHAHWRAERRAFIRAQHPDRGGDPDHFITGLARFEFRSATAPRAADHRHAVYRSTRLDRRLVVTLRRLRRRLAGRPRRDLK